MKNQLMMGLGLAVELVLYSTVSGVYGSFLHDLFSLLERLFQSRISNRMESGQKYETQITG